MNIVKPTNTTERIASLDFLRGIAILGILFINIENFAYPDSWSPWKFGFQSTIDHTTRFWVYFLTQGKFYSIFALLFGVGSYIFLERLESKNIGLKSMDIYARRLLWLFVIGILHAYLIWEGDVLYHYAICGLLLIPFRSVRPRYLYLTIAFIAFLLLVKSHQQTLRWQTRLSDYEQAQQIAIDKRTPEELQSIAYWKSRTEQKQADTSSATIQKATYLIGLKESFKHASAHKGMLYYQSLIFPSLMVMLLGMIFYKAGIFKNYKVWKHYWLITFLLLAVGLSINYLRYYHWSYEYFKPITVHWKAYLFTFPRELLGVSYVLVLNGTYQKFLKNISIKPVSSVGKMALSNYLFQNVLLGFIFYGYGFALYNQFSRFELLGIVLIIWIIQITLSYVWLRKYKYGPIEWIWRKLTYRGF